MRLCPQNPIFQHFVNNFRTKPQKKPLQEWSLKKTFSQCIKPWDQLPLCRKFFPKSGYCWESTTTSGDWPQTKGRMDKKGDFMSFAWRGDNSGRLQGCHENAGKKLEGPKLSWGGNWCLLPRHKTRGNSLKLSGKVYIGYRENFFTRWIGTRFGLQDLSDLLQPEGLHDSLEKERPRGHGLSVATRGVMSGPRTTLFYPPDSNPGLDRTWSNLVW